MIDYKNINGIITTYDNFELSKGQKFELSQSGKRLYILELNDLNDWFVVKKFNVKNILGTF